MSLPLPQKEHMVLTKDLVYKITCDHVKTIQRTLELAEDAAPGDNGVKMVIMHTECLNGLFTLHTALCAEYGVRDNLSPKGRAIYAQMMIDLVETGWEYINHHLKEPSK